MYEVELKVETDHDAVRERLEALDAEYLGTVTQSDTYYDAPHRNFAETDEALRIRQEASDDGSRVELTYKGPKVDPESKTREEVETGVHDADDAAAIVEALGFESAATVRKERDRYRLDDYTVTLDSVEGLGEFVEIETESEEVEQAREGAKDRMTSLGLDPEEQIRTSYLGLLLGDAEQ